MGKLLLSLVLFSILSCQSESRTDSFNHTVLTSPSGDKINTRLVYTPKDQEQGLSGVRPEDFKENEGMLFFYLVPDMRYFWMPDTYFDLDLFYLDQDLKITDIIRRLPHYVGRLNPELIPKARGVWSLHVLEMKADSPIGKNLKIGDQLKWSGSKNLQETIDHVKSKLSPQ